VSKIYITKGFRKETGLAYVAILVLLAIMSTLALAFLSKTGTLTLATANRLAGMQANYLAESAANHALWRLLNDPGFPADETVYYMHDLDGGRYGYKVRKPTPTTFATVATVGAAAAVETRQGYVQYLKPYNMITAYDKNGVSIPQHRRLLGASFSDPADTVNDGPDYTQWMVLKGNPQKKEMIMGTLDADNNIHLAVWDGTAWGHLSEFTTSSNEIHSCFDIAYENQSGKGLVVGRYAASGDVRYNIWDGNAWVFASPAQDVNLAPGSSLTYIDVASKPNSNEILIALAQFVNDLKVVQWDGAAFIDHGEIDDDMATNVYGSAEIVYEQQSGDALVLWVHKNSSQVYYRVWSGGSLSPTNLLLPFDFGEIPNVIRAAADPGSDYIFVAALDKSNDLNVAVWNGNAWINEFREISTSVDDNDGQVLDVAWEHSGEDVLVAWSPSGGNNVSYFRWQKGTALADHAVQTGPDFQAEQRIVRLHPIANTQKIILLVNTSSNDLRYSLWSGYAFHGNPGVLLESAFGTGYLPVDIAEFGVTYTGGSG